MGKWLIDVWWGGSAFLLLRAGTSLGIFLVYEKLPAGIKKYQG